MARSLAAVVVVMLALAWFVLHSMDTPTELAGALANGETGKQQENADHTVALRTQAQPNSLADEGLGRAGMPTASGASGSAAQIADSPDPAEGARLGAAFERAQALLGAGERAAAERLLRKTMDAAESSASRARAGLVLAGLVTRPAAARQLYSEAFRAGVVTGAEFEAVGQQLRQLNADPGASLLPNLEVGRYEVQQGDALWTLCHKVFPAQFDCNPEVGLIKLVNGIRGDTLRVGQQLMVPTSQLAIHVDTRELGLVVMLGDQVLAAYRVGLGKQGRTPRGAFTIEVKQENPVWWKDGEAIPYGDPRNVLGTRWLGFEDRPGTSGYGIHGTADPESIGLYRSMGCVRMRNEEVQELFEYVARGTYAVIH